MASFSKGRQLEKYLLQSHAKVVPQRPALRRGQTSFSWGFSIKRRLGGNDLGPFLGPRKPVKRSSFRNSISKNEVHKIGYGRGKENGKLKGRLTGKTETVTK